MAPYRIHSESQNLFKGELRDKENCAAVALYSEMARSVSGLDVTLASQHHGQLDELRGMFFNRENMSERKGRRCSRRSTLPCVKMTIDHSEIASWILQSFFFFNHVQPHLLTHHPVAPTSTYKASPHSRFARTGPGGRGSRGPYTGS